MLPLLKEGRNFFIQLAVITPTIPSEGYEYAILYAPRPTPVVAMYTVSNLEGLQIQYCCDELEFLITEK